MTDIHVLYRQHVNPRSRRTHSVAITRSGQCRTVYTCVCGAQHTSSSQFRRAKHVTDFYSSHEGCMRAALQARGVAL